MNRRRLILAGLGLGLLLVAVLVLVLVVWVLPSWLWHPLGYCTGTHVAVRDCKGYNSWSGSFSDIGEVTLVAGLATLTAGFWHQHNCHQKGCPWLIFHVHPDHGHPVCKKHFQDHVDDFDTGLDTSRHARPVSERIP